MGNTDRNWKKLGEIDPYYGVLSLPRFRDAATEGATRREFFTSGEDYVERIFAIIRDSLAPEFAPSRALDFGCGVGRVTIPLARRAAEVVGIDVSDSMLNEAAKNCEEVGAGNVTLLKSDDRLENLSGVFDFLHSYIVFQHIPVRRGEMILRQMLRRLADNGVGALHFTYADKRPRWARLLRELCDIVPYGHNLFNLAKGRPFRYPHVEMNLYNLNRLILHLQEHGCHQVHLRFSEHGKQIGVILFFKKTALPLF